MKEYKGSPKPLGASQIKKGINFALFSKHATKVTLIIEQNNQTLAFHLDPKTNRTGQIWHILIADLNPLFTYSYQLDGPREMPYFFHPRVKLIDPYAKCLNSKTSWAFQEEKYHPQGVFLEPSSFDWQGVSSPSLSMKDLIIYEMHVRGFTHHHSSGVKDPGTFLGIIEKIPYLKDLGINAIELMPVQEFNECGYQRLSPNTGKRLCNYYGYSTVNFFMPMSRFATDYHNAVLEFKTLVRELHRNKIEIILDIVFNHTAEKGKNEALFSFMGIDHETYYIFQNGHYLNYSGCGHTMKLNHPILRKFVQDVLHYWVTEMHVDGFRFDLASIMNRNMKGELLGTSPLVEDLSHDPILSKTKLIAEPWDIGAYQLGAFHPHESRWSEWNGKYRDEVRKFIKGDKNSKNDFAARLTGSNDIFPARKPSASINFITAHDGFTLMDLVSYNAKHNESNGEHNKDGASQNLSWNMGFEGDTDNPDIINLRNRQMKNFIVALMISKGVPMLHMGDEYGHTKKGNNNTWCQDNELNWFLWDHKSPFTDFVRDMIQFRKDHIVLHKDSFYQHRDIIWHGMNVEDPNWLEESPVIAFTIKCPDKKNLYVAFNAMSKTIGFHLPKIKPPNSWYQVVNTSHSPPYDFLTSGKEQKIESSNYVLEPYSSIILKMM